ncbi:MAG: class B sortase [Clostridia bacterium]|nr:class B sortase [Clostridia bacterium]
MAEFEKDQASPISDESKIAQRRAKDGVRLARKKTQKAATVLTESLDRLTEEDFSVRPKRKKTSRGFTVTQWIVLGLCLLVFLFSGYKFAGNLLEYAEAKKQYDELKEIFYSEGNSGDYLAEPSLAPSTPDLLSSMQTSAADAAANNSVSGMGDEENYQVILARLAKLKSLNEDTYGWLKVSGTDVDYPVVQGEDNDYYLRRSFYRSYLNSGSIFVDSNCKSLSENRNTVIYGHNMKDGTMFHSLHNLNNQNYFESAEIRLMTTEGIYVYDVYSVHQPHEMDRFFYTEFTDAEWREFLDWTKKQSFFPNSDVSLSRDDKIITLSTCVSTTQEEAYRFVVHGVLREVLTA